MRDPAHALPSATVLSRAVTDLIAVPRVREGSCVLRSSIETRVSVDFTVRALAASSLD
jgi:hypothetical protein